MKNSYFLSLIHRMLCRLCRNNKVIKNEELNIISHTFECLMKRIHGNEESKNTEKKHSVDLRIITIIKVLEVELQVLRAVSRYDNSKKRHFQKFID